MSPEHAALLTCLTLAVALLAVARIVVRRAFGLSLRPSGTLGEGIIYASIGACLNLFLKKLHVALTALQSSPAVDATEAMALVVAMALMLSFVTRSWSAE